MISKEMAKTLNEQINKELFSAYLYQSMSAYCSFIGLKGFANWFQVQVQEEIFHTQKFYNYILSHGEKVLLKTIEQPKIEFNSILELFEETLAHEKKVTQSINNLVKQANKEEDAATLAFLQWFVTEQVEEEANPTDILSQLKLVGDNGGGIFMIDKDLATRVFTPPTTTA